jgi:hypothetical protein
VLVQSRSTLTVDGFDGEDADFNGEYQLDDELPLVRSYLRPDLPRAALF